MKLTDEELVRAAGIWGGAPAVSDNIKKALGKYYAVEALLHEVAHAAAAGIRFDKRAPSRTNSYFRELNKRCAILGLVHEAQAIAVEKCALRALGLDKEIRLDAVVRDTWRNGTSGPALPWADFCRLIDSFDRRGECRDQGKEAARAFIRLVRPREQQRLRALLR